MKRPIGKLLTFSLLAAPLTGAFAQTTVNSGSISIIHGPGDLDLTGEMVYAVNFSINDAPFLVGRVPFIPDTRPPAGATFLIPNSVAPWETRPDFGATPEGEGLAHVFEDIRFSTTTTEAHLPVIAGETYKLQILWYENKGSYTRSWDISVEGAVSVDQVTSLGATPDGVPPDYDPTAGVVFTQQFTAGDGTLDVVMGQLRGDTPGTDVNPIWQGLTLERIRPDTDGDGLPDAWETASFGDLTKNGDADTDGDGLVNALELNLGLNPSLQDTDADGLKDGDEFNTLGTDPKTADTDGDGLTDGAELNTHHTNPTAKDTDLDGLTDGQEVNTLGSNPLVTDSDGDDYPDGIEVTSSTNPASPGSFPLISSFGRALTGAEAGAGLDLTGTFKYAFNVGPNGAPGLIRGVDFTDQTNNGLGGITISPGAEIAQFGNYPELGESDDDIALGNLLWSIRHAGPQGGKITVSMSGLTIGKPYKLQLLFREGCCQRAFDVLVDGQLKLDDFAPVLYQDGTGSSTRGALAVIGFLAAGTSVEVVLDGANVANTIYGDHNPILNGVTLEALTGADADGDSLDDLWEIANFGSLAQTGAGDFDSDGLPNLQENLRGTDPKVKDNDGDGLDDGPEVNTHLTDPRKVDTDSDGLSDGQEVLTLHTSPIRMDTDGDNYGDNSEKLLGSDPLSAASYPLISATVSPFTGGDPGEGLDLSGTFLYSFNVGSPGAAPGPVGDAAFTADTEAGIVVTTVNDIPNWIAPEYGDTANDDNLEFVMQSIRWTGAPGTPSIDLEGLTVGKVYKLQMLFAEVTSPGRGFDIRLDGTPMVRNFFPSVPQGGAGVKTCGAVVTIGFTAKKDTLNIVLDGTSATSLAVSDRNPTISAVTLETLVLPDTDSDSLPDVWELQFFGDLTRAGAADADSDGITNAAEFLAGTNPTLKDTDGDGLDDKAEITAGTNSLVADTDGDGLSDGFEIATLHTDPLLPDTDSDTFLDSLEYIAGSNPLSNASMPVVDIGVFTGGDPGEGLDLSGTFLYAFNIGTNAVTGQAGDAVFTSDNAPGITVTALNQIPNWSAPVLGDTPADNVLEGVLGSIRWSNAPTPVKVKLTGLTAGKRYRTQLLFFETGTNRGFDVILQGATIVYDFVPGLIQGAVTTQGAYISFEFTAPDTELNLTLDGAPTEAVDKNPTLSGMTLEEITASAPSNSRLSLASITATGVTFTAQGTAGKVYALDYSPSLTTGTWVEVSDNVVIGAGGSVQVTDAVAAHRTPGKGFWRLRDPALKPQP
ncbi:MAG: hypothetical protein V4726_12790 [Verrucomicrobiota bacterium]